MLFQHSLIENILSGRKTQTRRPVKPGDKRRDDGHVLSLTKTGTFRTRYIAGQDYAVQPKRGAPCLVVDGKPLRILITNISQSDIRDINPDDAVAEGFADTMEFFRKWIEIYDAKAYAKTGKELFINAWLATRPTELYLAWALTFQVVK